MSQTTSAPAIPVQLTVSKFSVKRKSMRKPRKYTRFMNVREFSPEIVKQQIMTFCTEVSDTIINSAIVSVNTDETGVNVTVIGADFQLSMIYTEGGQK